MGQDQHDETKKQYDYRSTIITIIIEKINKNEENLTNR